MTKPSFPVSHTGLAWILVAAGAAALANFLVRLPPPHQPGFDDLTSPQALFFPVVLIPFYLAIVLTPILMHLDERRWPSQRAWRRALLGVAFCVGCAFGPYAAVGIGAIGALPQEMVSLGTRLFDPPMGPAALTTVLLFATIVYALEQTGRRLSARVVIALVAAVALLSIGMLWQSRLEVYAWCAGWFEHGWRSWLRRFPVAGLLLVVPSGVAAMGRLRALPAWRTLPYRVAGVFLAAAAVGIPYRAPAVWRVEELEDVTFASVTEKDELLIVASRPAAGPWDYLPGALLLRRPGAATLQCLTRSAVMGPVFSSRYGTYASPDLKGLWGAALGPGARLRVAALDGSTSTAAFSFELPHGYVQGVEPELVVLGPKGSWAQREVGRLLAGGPDAWWPRPRAVQWRLGLASGDRRVLDVSDSSSEEWVAGNRLVVLVPGPEAYCGPCPCGVTRAELITVDLLSGATVRKGLPYPVPISQRIDLAPGGERFGLHAAASNGAWLCDLDGNLTPIAPIQCGPDDQPFCTPLLWKANGEAARFDEVGFRKAVDALGQSTRRLSLSRFSARELAGHTIVVQDTKGDVGSVVYELEPDGSALTPIGEDLLSVDFLPDSVVMVVVGSTTREVVRYWPATRRREVLLRCPSRYDPFFPRGMND